MSLLLLLAAASAPLARPAPSVPPIDGATGRATVRIISAVAIAGADAPPPSQSFTERHAALRLADGSARPTITLEFE